MFVIKVKNHVISLDSDLPDRAAPLEIEGDNPAGIRRWISEMSGFRGIGLDARSVSPLDLATGLSIVKASFEIVEGAEILKMPIEPLPEGAVW